ncbi:MAG: septum formation initiator family protein [Chloroflexota bacterium]|nr:septum formation initiator family protein [Chloroflexota bacterium]
MDDTTADPLTAPRRRTEPRPAALPWIVRRIAFVGALLAVGFVVFSGVEGLVQANSLDDRIASTQAEIEELRRDADQLAALVAWLDSDAYIERIAREDLGMVRPGEESFAVHAPQRGQLEIVSTPWWANLLPKDTE